MDIYVHMKGSHIGEFNIYQAPVIGFAVRKLSIAGELGANWVKQEIQFDSKVEFQVSQSWRLSGYWWSLELRGWKWPSWNGNRDL